jgi:hypothetical protein
MLEDRKTLVIEEEEQKPEWKKSFKATRTTTTTTSSFSTTCMITSTLVRNREKVTDAHLCYTLARQRYHKNSRKNKTKPKTQKKQRAMRAENDGGRAQPSAHSVVDCRRALRLWFPYTLSSSPKGSVTSTPPSSWMNEIFLIQVPSLLFHPTA